MYSVAENRVGWKVRDERGCVGAEVDVDVSVGVDVYAIFAVSILNIDISVWKLSKMRSPFH